MNEVKVVAIAPFKGLASERKSAAFVAEGTVLTVSYSRAVDLKSAGLVKDYEEAKAAVSVPKEKKANE